MANQYLPTDFVSKQVPFGMLNFSLDGKLMYFDKVNFIQRAFISRDEILLWFPLGSLARRGRFEICMNTGGSLGSNGIITGGTDSIWWFSAGEADANLIQKYYTTLQVDNLIAGATIPDATETVKGKLKLAGDLAGTADLPTVPALLGKANIDGQVFTGNISAPNLSGTNTGDQDLSVFELLANKSTNLSSPSDITYPTTKAVSDAIVANTLTFSNGLTKGVDNKVKLGGTLQDQFTVLTLNTSSEFAINSGGGNLEITGNIFNAYTRDPNYGNSGIFFSANIQEMKVLDQIGEKGFVYAVDYSVLGLLDDRWLADVGGVKKLIAQIPVGNGLSKSGSNNRIVLGGTINQATTLDLQDDLTISARAGVFNVYGADRSTALTSYGAALVYAAGGTFGAIEAKTNISDPNKLVGLVVVRTGSNPLEMILYDESQSFGAKYNGNFYTKGRLNDRWIPDLGGVKSYVTSLGYELLTNKVGNLSAPNANTYLNTLGLSSALSGKVNTNVPITNGYGVTVGGDLTSAVSISLNTSVVDNRYLRKDVDDNNGVHKLILGVLESGDTLLTGSLTIPSLGVGTSDDILVVDPSGLIQKKTLIIAGNFGVANGSGANMFDVDLGTDLRFEGLNDTTVTFDPVTKKISISSIPGSGSGGAVVSFNSRTGAVVPVSGDYNTNMVPESGGVLYFTNTRSIASTLTGFSASAITPIVAADSILAALGKAQGQINNRVPISREITIAGTAGRLIVGGAETQNLSGNPNWTLDLSTIGTAGSYTKITTDAYGRVISGSNPTTLGSFGIMDAYTKTEADDKYYLQTNPAGYITSASLPDLSPYALKTGVGSTGTWPISITGNSATANVATLWGDRTAALNAIVNTFDYFVTRSPDGVVRLTEASGVKAKLGIGDGSTLVNSISGNSGTSSLANNSTQWNGYQNSFADAISGSTIDAIAGQYNDGKFYRFNATALRNFLGSPSGGETLKSVLGRDNTGGQGQVLALRATDPANGYLELKNDSNPYGSAWRLISGVWGVSQQGLSIFNSLGSTPFYISEVGNTHIGYATDQGYKFAVNGDAFVNGNISAGPASISQSSISNIYARFGHYQFNTATNYGFMQDYNGNAFIGSPLLRVESPITVTGKLTVGTGAFASNTASLYTDAVGGTVLTMKSGSSIDFNLVTPAGQTVFDVPTGTRNVKYYSDVDIAGTSYNRSNMVVYGQLNGTNAIFTGNVTAPNFIGNASSATNWGGAPANFSVAATAIDAPIVIQDGIVKPAALALFRTWLGLGSNAFNSTTIPTNTNQLTNGAGFITSGALSAYLPLAGGALTGAVTSSASISANGFFDTSDIRLKEVIDQSFDTSSIKAISYKRRDMSDDNVWVGYSAQDVREVMPDAVNENENGLLSLNYTQVLVNKVQALENEIAKMKGVLYGVG